MSILAFVLFGSFIGVIARAVVPPDQKMDLLATLVLGVGGSFAGGFVGSLFTNTRITEFHTGSAIGGVLGAIIVLGLASGLLRDPADA